MYTTSIIYSPSAFDAINLYYTQGPVFCFVFLWGVGTLHYKLITYLNSN